MSGAREIAEDKDRNIQEVLSSIRDVIHSNLENGLSGLDSHARPHTNSETFASVLQTPNTPSNEGVLILTQEVPEPLISQAPLEGLTRELLRPMLKEWLDTHLPSLVETLVIDHIEKIAKNKGV